MTELDEKLRERFLPNRPMAKFGKLSFGDDAKVLRGEL
jgi:hypothetical protein